MSDLYNDFPSWGETGEYPQVGFFYEGGDQVNEKHMDALWNGIDTHIDNLNTGIRDRVRDLHGDVVLDQGLVASIGSGTREVDVTASTAGAYVDGQRTGSVSATTTTHTANPDASTRTDVIWLDADGMVGKTEDTTTVSDARMKVAEVDVAPDDTISDVRNYSRDHVQNVASENAPSNPEPGDRWHDLSANRTKTRQGGSFHTVLTEQDDLTFTAGDGLDGSETEDLVGGADFSVSVDVTDLLGVGIAEDGSNNLELDESTIKDGGAKQIDAQEFSGGDGAPGNILFSDGSDAYWDVPPVPSISDDGITVVANASDVNYVEGVNASDDGDGTATVSAEESRLQASDGFAPNFL